LILKSLRDDYGHDVTSVRSLAAALDLQGFPVTVERFQFALQYLSDQGYIDVRRAHEMPGWRRDRWNATHGDTILFLKLNPKGVQLLDGLIPEDPGVRF